MNTMSYNADLECGSTYRFCVSLAYWFGAFTFVALFPYMRNVINLLKSENIRCQFAERRLRFFLSFGKNCWEN